MAAETAESHRGMHDHHFSFGDRILIQMAAGGLVGAVADRLLTVLIGMIASLVVGVVMELVKAHFQKRAKARELANLSPAYRHPQAQVSGGYCQVHPRGEPTASEPEQPGSPRAPRT